MYPSHKNKQNKQNANKHIYKKRLNIWENNNTHQIKNVFHYIIFNQS